MSICRPSSNTALNTFADADITIREAVELQYTEFSINDSSGEFDEEHDPVLLLHGLLGQKRNFASLGKSLSMQLQKKRKIYALDLRNHGTLYTNGQVLHRR